MGQRQSSQRRQHAQLSFNLADVVAALPATIPLDLVTLGIQYDQIQIPQMHERMSGVLSRSDLSGSMTSHSAAGMILEHERRREEERLPGGLNSVINHIPQFSNGPVFRGDYAQPGQENSANAEAGARARQEFHNAAHRLRIQQFPSDDPRNYVSNLERLEKIDFDMDQVPREYKSTILLSVMTDPVTINNNNAKEHFEFSEIQAWHKVNATCPVTRIPFKLENIERNDSLKAEIEAFVEKAEADDYLAKRQIVPANYFKVAIFQSPCKDGQSHHAEKVTSKHPDPKNNF